MKKLLFFIPVLMVLLFASCGGSDTVASKTLVALDLSSHGIPATIKAPEGATVSDNPLALEKGVSVTEGIYKIDVELVEEYANAEGNLKAVKDEMIDIAKSGNDFVSIVMEEDNGFIHKTNYEGEDNYHFFYVAMINGKQVEFSEGLSLFSNYTEEDAKAMYNAVKQ